MRITAKTWNSQLRGRFDVLLCEPDTPASSKYWELISADKGCQTQNPNEYIKGVRLSIYDIRTCRQACAETLGCVAVDYTTGNCYLFEQACTIPSKTGYASWRLKGITTTDSPSANASLPVLSQTVITKGTGASAPMWPSVPVPSLHRSTGIFIPTETGLHEIALNTDGPVELWLTDISPGSEGAYVGTIPFHPGVVKDPKGSKGEAVMHFKVRELQNGNGGSWDYANNIRLVANRRYQLTALHVELCNYLHPTEGRYFRVGVKTPVSAVTDCSNNRDCGNDRSASARWFKPMLATSRQPNPPPGGAVPPTPEEINVLGLNLRIGREPNGIACPGLTVEWRGCGSTGDNDSHDSKDVAADVETGKGPEAKSTQLCADFCVGKGYEFFVLAATYPYSSDRCYCRKDDALFGNYNLDPASCGPPCDGELDLSPTRYCGGSRKMAAYRAYADPKGNSQCCPSATFFDDATKRCVACPAGLYTDPTTKSSGGVSACGCHKGLTSKGGKCVQCAKGTYKDLVGNDPCTACPASSPSSDEGARAETACFLPDGAAGVGGGAGEADIRGDGSAAECRVILKDWGDNNVNGRYNPVGMEFGRPVYLRETKDRWLFWRPTPVIDHPSLDCWNVCDRKYGECATGYCGTRGLCCRQGEAYIPANWVPGQAFSNCGKLGPTSFAACVDPQGPDASTASTTGNWVVADNRRTAQTSKLSYRAILSSDGASKAQNLTVGSSQETLAQQPQAVGDPRAICEVQRDGASTAAVRKVGADCPSHKDEYDRTQWQQIAAVDAGQEKFLPDNKCRFCPTGKYFSTSSGGMCKACGNTFKEPYKTTPGGGFVGGLVAAPKCPGNWMISMGSDAVTLGGRWRRMAGRAFIELPIHAGENTRCGAGDPSITFAMNYRENGGYIKSSNNNQYWKWVTQETCKERCSSRVEGGACRCYMESTNTKADADKMCEGCYYYDNWRPATSNNGSPLRLLTKPNGRDSAIWCNNTAAFAADPLTDTVDVDVFCQKATSTLQFKMLYRSGRYNKAVNVGVSFTALPPFNKLDGVNGSAPTFVPTGVSSTAAEREKLVDDLVAASPVLTWSIGTRTTFGDSSSSTSFAPSKSEIDEANANGLTGRRYRLRLHGTESALNIMSLEIARAWGECTWVADGSKATEAPNVPLVKDKDTAKEKSGGDRTNAWAFPVVMTGVSGVWLSCAEASGSTSGYGELKGTCTKANAGFWLNLTSPVACNPGETSPVGATKASHCVCAPGYAKAGSSCVACAAGLYGEGGAAPCKACISMPDRDTGMVDVLGMDSCACGAGTTTDAATGKCVDVDECKDHADGSPGLGALFCAVTGNGTACQNVATSFECTCQPGSWNDAAANEGRQATAYHAWDGKHGANSLHCSRCPPHTWKATVGDGPCTPCVAGRTRLEGDGSSASQCVCKAHLVPSDAKDVMSPCVAAVKLQVSGGSVQTHLHGAYTRGTSLMNGHSVFTKAATGTTPAAHIVKGGRRGGEWVFVPALTPDSSAKVASAVSVTTRYALANAKPASFFMYMGCYRDDSYRDLQVYLSKNKQSLASCGKLCSGYNFFALQNKGYCYCGNAYGTHPSYERLDDSFCTPCTNDDTPVINTEIQRCGGSYINAIYSRWEEPPTEPYQDGLSWKVYDTTTGRFTPDVPLIVTAINSGAVVPPAACAVGTTWSLSGGGPCATCATCAAGVKTACTKTSDTVCNVKCVAGTTFSASGSAPCTMCAADATCASGVKTACVPGADIVCNGAIAPCVGGTSFSGTGKEPCGACAADSTCTVGIKTSCTTTADTVCNVACEAGKTFSSTGLTPCNACAADSTCSSGVKTACTTTTDTVCSVPCVAGSTFSATGNAPCSTCSACIGGTSDVATACSVSADVTCVRLFRITDVHVVGGYTVASFGSSEQATYRKVLAGLTGTTMELVNITLIAGGSKRRRLNTITKEDVRVSVSIYVPTSLRANKAKAQITASVPNPSLIPSSCDTASPDYNVTNPHTTAMCALVKSLKDDAAGSFPVAPAFIARAPVIKADGTYSWSSLYHHHGSRSASM